MAGLYERANEPPGSLKVSKKHNQKARKPEPPSSEDSLQEAETSQQDEWSSAFAEICNGYAVPSRMHCRATGRDREHNRWQVREHYSAQHFLRVREVSPSVFCADDPCFSLFLTCEELLQAAASRVIEIRACFQIPGVVLLSDSLVEYVEGEFHHYPQESETSTTLSILTERSVMGRDLIHSSIALRARRDLKEYAAVLMPLVVRNAARFRACSYVESAVDRGHVVIRCWC
ncbi:hypothetical protein ANN_19058 [Periplaneta americana]|uniref:Uncharacterized protein n=1 Tax=Periplaneta americana TaxID=6978 RepID=A0ABQ8SSL1_PERAM|nr:hypothetical protein ANN_19058 [Periplaneta americana]